MFAQYCCFCQSKDLQLLFLVCIHSFLDQNCTTPTNNSTENTSITLCQDSSKILKDVPLDVTKIGVLSTIIIFTVLGNLVVIIAIAARRAKMTRMYYFILHLSLADLLVSLKKISREINHTICCTVWKCANFSPTIFFAKISSN